MSVSGERAAGRRGRLTTAAGITAALLAILALWQVAAWAAATEVLPGPWTVGRAFLKEAGGGLEEHILVSAYRVALAIVIAASSAAPLGLLLGMSDRAYAISAPLLYLAYPIPKIVLLPILLLFLGLGDAPKVAMIALILFFQVLILVRDDVRTVRPELVLSVRSLGAGAWSLLRHVYVPAALPGLFSALRVSVGVAIAVLFFVESFGTQAGLGYYILVETWGRVAYPQMYAGVVAMALLGLTFYFLLEGLERRLCRWTRVGR
ncbi:MAG: ABC transporter permease subunit [Chloroflexi bacterium]|nr:ABC transporter permease subunit [Chloroflexota bacterium]